MSFRPSAASTAVLGTLALACAWLGAWQIQRAEWKQARQDDFDAAAVVASLTDSAARQTYTRARLYGQFEPTRHVLVDNRVYRGRPGVHVLTPFTEQVSGTVVLVNRGWLPLAPDRATLPEVPTPSGPVELEGHLEPLRQPGVALGEPDRLASEPWPQLVTYPTLDEIERVIDAPLHAQVLYLSSASAGGFDGRDWNPFPMGPEKHRGYALQWFALALTALIAWAVLARKRGRSANGRGAKA